jgi:superfamily I DNA/RNA helicase
MELTELQKRIINAPEDKIAVNACAAALKTSTLIEKIRKLLIDGTEPSSIAVITFTRMAAQELITRLGDDYKEGMFVGTIHSLAAHFLVINGLGNKIGKIAEDEDFDKLFDLCKDLNIYHSYSWLFVDECQDTGKKQLEFIFDLIQPEHYFCVFDFNQTIYSFNGSRPDLLRKYLSKDATFYTLNQNYRNARNILSYAKSIIRRAGGTDNSVPMRNSGDGIVYETDFNADWLADYIKSTGEFKDWAVLCRTNADIAFLSKELNKRDIPTATFRQGDLTKKQLEELLTENKVKVLTAHSSKGLAWNNVAVYDLKWWNDEEIRLNYVAATRARDVLLWMKKPKVSRKRKVRTEGWSDWE